MIDFAEPPRQPTRWFVAPAPALAVAATMPGSVRRSRSRMALPFGLAGLFVGAIALIAQIPHSRRPALGGFAKTRDAAVAAQGLRQVIGVAPRLGRVRESMAAAQAFCRPAEGRGADSLLVCLGDAVRFNEAYSRMTFRFVSRGDSVTRVVVCPALVTLRRTTPPRALLAAARPSLSDASCWRDPANPTHADWAYAALPGVGKFTTVPEPDAPRMRAESAPAGDTVVVVW